MKESPSTRAPKVEEEEEDTKELTYEEFLAQKKKVNFRKEARKVEEVKKENIEKVGVQKDKVSTLTSHIRANETYTGSTA